MDSWKRKLRMGMVGGGQGAFIGGVHRTAAAMDGQIELCAGCFSRDFENTKTTGEQLYLDSGRLYKSYEEMAEKEAKLPDDQKIDFVSIVTPNKSHFPIAKAFLEAGFHVVCDKPMTYTLDEAKELVALVEKSGLVFALTHNYTGTPMVREAKKLFTSGKMGTVRKAMMEYLQDFLAYPWEKEGMKQAVWRVDPAQSGIGGTLGDVGTHALNLFEFITEDPIVELCADKSAFLPGRKLDEDANILIRLKNGGKGIIAVSQIATGEENGLRARIYGSEGSIKWEQENPNYLTVAKFGEPSQRYTRNAGYTSEAAQAASRIPTGHPEGYLEAFANIYCDAAEAIRASIDGKPLKTKDYKFPTVYDGLRGMLFIYKAVESSDKGSVWLKME
jgi:predicted dehydrogenase